MTDLDAGSSAAEGGTITLDAGNNLTVVGQLDCSSTFPFVQGGTIILSATHTLFANILRSGIGDEPIYSSYAGPITASAGDSLQVNTIYARSVSGPGADMTLTSPLIYLGQSGQLAANISGTLFLQRPALTGTANFYLSGTTTGPGSLMFDAGAGLINLASDLGHTGKTIVSSGILYMNGYSLPASTLVLQDDSQLIPGISIVGGSVAVQSGTWSPYSTSNFVISDNTLFDKVQVSGTASLDGIFHLAVNPGYTPALGTEFEVMTYGSHLAEFGTYTGLRLSGSLVLNPVYSGSGLKLVASNVLSGGSNSLQSVPISGTNLALGDSFDGLTTSTTHPSLITGATIIAGTASQATTVTMAMVSSGTSNVFQSGTGGSAYYLDLNGTQSDFFVLQLDYDEALAIAAVGDERNMYLSSSHGTPYANAVLANTNDPGKEASVPTPFFRAFNPATDFHLGYYGVDTVNNRVWAVLNHNSAFGINSMANQALPPVVPMPLVSVAATVPDAYELGAASGQFTITRSGTGELSVNLSVAGSATNGTRYNLLTGPLVIPAGQSSVSFAVTPIANDSAEGDQTVELTLEPGTDFTPVGPRSATVTIHDTPLDQWKTVCFGADANNPGKAGDNAVNNAAGIANLMAYALGLDPVNARATQLPATSHASVSGTNYLALNFVRNPNAHDLTYTVEGSSDMSTWSELSVYRNGAWSASDSVTETGDSSSVSVQVRDSAPVGSANCRFLRLKVNR